MLISFWMVCAILVGHSLASNEKGADVEKPDHYSYESIGDYPPVNWLTTEDHAVEIAFIQEHAEKADASGIDVSDDRTPRKSELCEQRDDKSKPAIDHCSMAEHALVWKYADTNSRVAAQIHNFDKESQLGSGCQNLFSLRFDIMRKVTWPFQALVCRDSTHVDGESGAIYYIITESADDTRYCYYYYRADLEEGFIGHRFATVNDQIPWIVPNNTAVSEKVPSRSEKLPKKSEKSPEKLEKSFDLPSSPKRLENLPSKSKESVKSPPKSSRSDTPSKLGKSRSNLKKEMGNNSRSGSRNSENSASSKSESSPFESEKSSSKSEKSPSRKSEINGPATNGTVRGMFRKLGIGQTEGKEEKVSTPRSAKKVPKVFRIFLVARGCHHIPKPNEKPKDPEPSYLERLRKAKLNVFIPVSFGNIITKK